MLLSLSLDNLVLHDFTAGNLHRDVGRVEGLVGIAQPKGESRPSTEQHGSRNRSRFQGSKLVTIDGECWGVTQGDAFDCFEDVAEVFERTLEQGAKLLKWRHSSTRHAGGVLDLQALVKCAGPLLPPLEEGAALLRYQGVLEQMDPRAYGQTLNLGVGPGPYTPDGRTETPPLVRLVGPLQANSSYSIVAGGVLVCSINLTAPALANSNDKIEVDHARKTITRVGLLPDNVTVMRDLRPEYLSPASSYFSDLKPRVANRVDVSGLLAGGRVEVEWRDAYGG